jgi:hypothetical protein
LKTNGAKRQRHPLLQDSIAVASMADAGYNDIFFAGTAKASPILFAVHSGPVARGLRDPETCVPFFPPQRISSTVKNKTARTKAGCNN